MDAMRSIARACLLLCTLSACVAPTSFQGAAHYPGGPGACRTNCEANGMEMSAFVYSGEFATSCVCRARRATAPPPSQAPAPPRTSADEADEADEAAQSAAAGVVDQMRRIAEQSRQQQHRKQQQRTSPAGGRR